MNYDRKNVTVQEQEHLTNKPFGMMRLKTMIVVSPPVSFFFRKLKMFLKTKFLALIVMKKQALQGPVL